MKVFYKRVTTWCKWPNNDVKDTDYVYFSTSKRNFDNDVFLFLTPETPVKNRKEFVALALRIKESKVELLKYY